MIARDNYTHLSLEELILLATLSVRSRGEDCSFERLVNECFTLFPKKFSFRRYPKWPDATKLDRPLRKLKERGLLTGGRAGSFQVSPLGKKVSSRTAKRLKSTALDLERPRPNQGRKEHRTLDRVKQSNLFQRFLAEGNKLQAGGDEIRPLFLCTMETPARVVLQNIGYIQELAREIRDKPLSKFLLFCEKKVKGGPR